MKPRAEYLEANKLSQTKPWVAEGVSRATWYRKQRETGLAAIHKNNALDRVVSKGSGNPSPTPSKAWVSEHGSSSTQLPALPDWSNYPMSALRHWSPRVPVSAFIKRAA